MKRKSLAMLVILGAVGVVLHSTRDQPSGRIGVKEIEGWQRELKESPTEGNRIRLALGIGALAHSCGTLRRSLSLSEKLQREVPGYKDMGDVKENIRQLRERYRRHLADRGLASDEALVALLKRTMPQVHVQNSLSTRIARAEVLLCLGEASKAEKEAAAIAAVEPAIGRLIWADALIDLGQYRQAMSQLAKAGSEFSRSSSPRSWRSLSVYSDLLVTHQTDSDVSSLREQWTKMRASIAPRADTVSALLRLPERSATQGD